MTSLLQTYSAEIDSLPADFHTVGSVLYCSVLAVVQHNAQNSQDRNCPPHDEYLSPAGKLETIHTAGAIPTFRALLKELNQNSAAAAGVVIYNYENHHEKVYGPLLDIDAPIVPNRVANVPDLIVFERLAIIRGQINRLLRGNNGMPDKPKMSLVERGIQETELLRFSSLSPSDLYRCNQMQEFNEMLLHHTKELPNFTGTLMAGGAESSSALKRRFFRNHSAFRFAQILTKEIIREPIVVRTYYAMTDELLYALHWPPPDRRIKKESWSVKVPDIRLTSTSTQEGQKDNRNEVTEEEDEPIAITVDKAGVVVNDEAAVQEMKQEEKEEVTFKTFTVETVTITPAGKSIVMLKKNASSENAWLSIYTNDSTIGLRLNSIVKPTGNKENSAIPTDNVDIIDQSETAQDVQPLAKDAPTVVNGTFFCQTDDDVRIIACKGPSPSPSKKPDKFGTVCFEITYPNGLQVKACSNGTMQFFAGDYKLETKKYNRPVMGEVSRLIGIGGTVMKSLKDSPYTKEFMLPDGTRLLYRDVDNTIRPETSQSLPYQLFGFHRKLTEDTPSDCYCIKLLADGSVMYYCNGTEAVIPSKMSNTLSVSNDPESKSKVCIYADGRIMTMHADGIVDCLFEDGTRMTTHQNGSLLLIAHPYIPVVEMDLEVDSVGRSHAQGIDVPINKGGERVRSRVALPDGSALLIKYDTRVTATTNGSLKIVRRDRTVLTIRDDGTVNYTPRTSWNEQQQESFLVESIDVEQPKAPKSPQQHSASTATLKKRNVTTGDATRSVANMLTNDNLGISKRRVAIASRMSEGRDIMSPGAGRMEETSKKNGSEIVKDTLIDTSVKETIFTFNILKMTSFIQDYEFNRFRIDLVNSPMEPKVELSGEVEGLKPPAVADSPMQPRLFVVNRSAEAVEVVSSQEVSDWEKLVLTCPDAKKETAVAESRLCDLGGTKQHQYFLQRKLLKASIYDPFSFEEVFGKRSWQNKRLPAAAVYAIRSHSNQIDRTKHVYTPRYFEKLSLLEQMPLSSQGYLQLSIDLKRCEEFRTERLLSIDRFAVEETRSPEELVEVERMNLRLKQVYKAAKINAAKRKADKEKSAAAAANNIAEEDEEEDGVDAKNSSIIQKLPEDIEEDNEEDDENVQFDEDDEEEEIDVQEKEIRESFHDYCVEVANVSKISAAAKLLPIEFVPDALVRIFNKFISADLIKKGLERCGVFDESIDNLNLHEFRNLYKGIDYIMRMQEQGNPIEENSDDYIFPMGAHDSKLIDLEKIDLASHPSGMDSARSKNTVSSKGGPVSPSPPLSPTSYWSSPNAHKGFRDAKTAPPLDLRKVDFGEPMETPLSAANVPSTADYAAGSALHFARKNNRSM